MEMTSNGTLRLRLAGSSIEAAMGIGMTDRSFDELFDTKADRGIGAETYALSLIHGAGLLRRGLLSFDGKNAQPFEVLALPFADSRVAAGTVLIAAVRPFIHENHSFIDLRKNIRIRINKMFMLPPSNVEIQDQIPAKLSEALLIKQVELNVVDADQFAAILNTDEMSSEADVHSFAYEGSPLDIARQLN